MIDTIVKNAIQDEFDTEITSTTAVSGGDINKAAKCRLNNGKTVFVKYHKNAPENMFQAEAKGLELLRKHAPEDVLVPEVLSQPDKKSEALVLEWIETGSSDQTTHEKLGRGLAHIHKTTQSNFGLDHDNFIGKLHQSNSEHATWSDFFFQERLEPQIRLAIDRALLTKNEMNLAEHISSKLDSIYPCEPAALLHGDLWGGNYMVEQSGKPVLIDPAVYFGHREMDIAFTELFGGFPRAFYQAYEEHYPLQPGFEERKDLSNLYPILVHTNLFGGHYARQAKSMLQKFA